ncbi:hypothetical protein [Streptomyces sp. MH60]|uniref:hypothetical protein n=1 Tax=Streptomyces sp. MH60 TaxID=1940758 RepID=UPI000CEDC3E6|nr:hypothetical protein [Streptomyces sp. MH60]PPS89460.1 hypothetical protein BZZ08_01606 [Streptomyces sp. MH60]
MPVQQLQVSNPSSGVVVVTPDADRPKSYLRFEAKGDATGEDVKIISRETAFQAPLVKAVKRGVLVIDDDISGDEELQRVLGTVQKRQPVGEKPLTAVRVDYVYDEESNSYNKVDRDVRVVIDPLQKG